MLPFLSMQWAEQGIKRFLYACQEKF